MMPDFGIGCGLGQSRENQVHLCVVLVGFIIDADDSSVVGVFIGLVEYTQDFKQPSVDLSAQKRYLHDDAVVVETFDE